MSSTVKPKMQSFNFLPFHWTWEDEVDRSTEIAQTVIRTYGWNELNESVYCFITDFDIPIWIELPEHIDWTETQIMKLQLSIKNMQYKTGFNPTVIKRVYKEKLYYANLEKDKEGKYRNKKFSFIEVSFRSMKAVSNFVYSLKRKPLYLSGLGQVEVKLHTAEGTITPVLKLLAIANLPSSSWIKCRGIELTDDDKMSSKKYEYRVSYKDMVKMPEDDAIKMPMIYPKIMSFDNEAYSSISGSMPNVKNPKDKVFMIGFTMLTQIGKDKEYQKYVLSLGNPSEVEGVIIKKYRCEADLYIGFSRFIRELDPDVIIGYNIFGWDIPFMYDRAVGLLNIKTEFENMSAVSGKQAQLKEINWESSAYGKQDLKYFEVEGRIFMDLLPYIKRNYKWSNYRLETACEEILKDSNKDPLKAKELFKIWERQRPDELGIVAKYCFVEGTKVSLKYRNESIEKLIKNNDKILSFDENKNGLVYSEQVNFFDNGIHECVEVELIDGSKVICTKDHKILLKDNSWKEAEKLTIEDSVKCGLVFPSYDIEEELSSCKHIDFGLFKINTKEDMNKAYALMRLLGYLMTDGYITKDRAELFIGCKLDVDDIIEDIKIITNKDIKYREQKNVFQVHLPMEITKYFLTLEGMVSSKRRDTKATIPNILKNLPKCLIREFLGGIFGGDGHCPSFSFKSNKFSGLAFSQTINKEYNDSLINVLNEYKNMLRMFGIESEVIDTNKSGGSSNFCTTIQLNIPYKYTTKFEDEIGFRYCYHKSLRLRIACCFRKIQLRKIEFYDMILDEIKDKINNNNFSFHKAYNYVLDKYKNIPTKSTFKSRKDIGFNGFKFMNLPEASASLFLENIGASNLFKQNNTNKKTYSVSREADCIPAFYLKVNSINDIGKRKVYDIEVKDTHTFIANGFVVHNCAQDTWVTLQIFEKTLAWFDLAESATVNGVPIPYLYLKGQQIKMYAQVLKYCYHNDIVVQSNAYEVKDDENYSGAFVQEPISGIYNTILPFDFASLYPSIMQAYNIDFSKLVLDSKIPDECCHVFDWTEHNNCKHDPDIIASEQRKKDREDKSIQKLIKEGMTETEAKETLRAKNAEKAPPKEKKIVCGHFRYRFLKQDVLGNGVVPTLLTTLLKARKDTRKVIAQNKDKLKELRKKGLNDEADILADINVVLDKRQNAYKVSCNSMYGALGARKGYLPFLPGAMCVTSKGRESIKKASKFLEDDCKATVIYNDTDSCYTYFPQLEGKTAEEIWDFAEGLVQRMVDIKLFPSPMKLEFEDKVYVKFMILTKKRYCAYMMSRDGKISDKMLIRGIALTRRDNCKFLRNVYEQSIRYILDNTNELSKLSKEMERKEIMNNPSVKGLLELINDNVNYLFQRKYGYKDFVITQGLTKLEYKTKNPPAHVAVYEKMTKRGIAVPVGTRIEYVVIDLMNGYDKKVKKFEKTEDMEYFNEFKEILRIDYLHYLESQGMVPLDELLKVCIRLEDYMETVFQDRINHNKMVYSLKKLFEPRINWVE